MLSHSFNNGPARGLPLSAFPKKVAAPNPPAGKQERNGWPLVSGLLLMLFLLLGGGAGTQNGIPISTVCKAAAVQPTVVTESYLQSPETVKTVAAKRLKAGPEPKIPVWLIVLFFVLLLGFVGGVVVLNIWIINLLLAKKFLLGFGLLAAEILIILGIRSRKRRHRRGIKKK